MGKGGAAPVTYNQLTQVYTSSALTLSSDSLTFTTTAGQAGLTVCKTGHASSGGGVYYFEAHITTFGTSTPVVGVSTSQHKFNNTDFLGTVSATAGYRGGSWGYDSHLTGTQLYTGTGSAQTSGCYIGVKVDLNAMIIYFYLNGVLQSGAEISSIPSGTYYAVGGSQNSMTVVTLNFGATTFNCTACASGASNF